jgi:hypothetical protein
LGIELAMMIVDHCLSNNEMAPYLHRNCPRCAGYLPVVFREPGRNVPVRAVYGHCVDCNYSMAWVVISGKGPDPIPNSRLYSLVDSPPE